MVFSACFPVLVAGFATPLAAQACNGFAAGVVGGAATAQVLQSATGSYRDSEHTR